jgi:hypothetical protein
LALALTFALAFTTTFTTDRLLLNRVPTVVLLLPLLLLQFLCRRLLPRPSSTVLLWLVNSQGSQ